VSTDAQTPTAEAASPNGDAETPPLAHKILLVTDAWEPQVNGVVRTLANTMRELTAIGCEIEVISPVAWSNASIVASRSSWLPKTLMNTRAKLMSGATSTRRILANPSRGSLSSCWMIWLNSSRRIEPTCRLRLALITPG
jgi:hypothetical protein